MNDEPKVGMDGAAGHPECDRELAVPVERIDQETATVQQTSAECYSLGMRSTVLAVTACASALACGSSPPVVSTTPPRAPASRAADANRRLDGDECRSLGQFLSTACQTRPNERSARVEGWCSEIIRGVGDGSWVTGDCLKHVSYMDSECLRAAANVHVMMDCDKSIDRSE
jgi:hypothetical protein